MEFTASPAALPARGAPATAARPAAVVHQPVPRWPRHRRPQRGARTMRRHTLLRLSGLLALLLALVATGGGTTLAAAGASAAPGTVVAWGRNDLGQTGVPA